MFSIATTATPVAVSIATKEGNDGFNTLHDKH